MTTNTSLTQTFIDWAKPQITGAGEAAIEAAKTGYDEYGKPLFTEVAEGPIGNNATALFNEASNVLGAGVDMVTGLATSVGIPEDIAKILSVVTLGTVGLMTVSGPWSALAIGGALITGIMGSSDNIREDSFALGKFQENYNKWDAGKYGPLLG